MALRSSSRGRLLGAGVVLWCLVAVLGLWAGSAFAADPPAATTVAMTGQGTVVGGEESAQQLRLKLTASDGSNWLLEMTLSPLGAQRSASGSIVYSLGGSFTLGLPQHPLAKGTVSGTMDQTGAGDLKLKQTSGPASLDVPFTVAGDGQISAPVSGTWPVLPQAQPVPAAAAAPATPPVNHFWWYLSRSAGLVAYIMLFLSVAFGLILRTNGSGATGRRVYLELHTFLAVLGLAFMGLHIGALVGDKYVNFRVAQLLLPVNLPYRPAATAAGIFGMYGFVIVMMTFLVRRWLGRKVWRAVHGLAIVMFVLVLLHGITAGTDTVVPWVRWMYTLTAGATAFLAILHYFRRKNLPAPVTAPVQPARLQRRGSSR